MEQVGVALTFAAIGAFIWGMSYLKYRRRREERDLVHRERILAMEKGIPLPELPSLEENGSAAGASYPDLLPKLSLGCGLLLVSLGVGLVLALPVMHFRDPEVPTNLWAFGFIPLMLGFGSLIYYWLIRRPQG